MSLKQATMNEMPAAIRPETRALDTLIQQIIAQAERSQGEGDRMVFLGNRHQSFPTAVIEDPVLEPVDKVIWMVIMLAAREMGRDTAFPGYEIIGKRANVASRSTIARAIAILRATRWLTLCARVRRASGKFHGNLYALHDEPLPLVDALHLDTRYMAFLNQATGHGHARVRAVAQGVLDSIGEGIQAGEDVTRQEHAIERRLESRADRQGRHPRRFFSFTAGVIRQLYPNTTAADQGVNHHDQNSNSVRVRNLPAQNSNSSSSSKYINTTTTNTPSNFDIAGESGQPLVYPSRLSANQRDIAARYLDTLSPDQRQPILDELEGRFRAEGKGMKPVYDAISFLHALCKRVHKGDFQPNLGLGVCEARAKEVRAESKRIPSPTPSKETEERRQRRMAICQTEITKMRKILGMRASTHDQAVSEES